jgi:hypothetical protein
VAEQVFPVSQQDRGGKGGGSAIEANSNHSRSSGLDWFCVTILPSDAPPLNDEEPALSNILVKAIRARVRNPQSLVYAARIIFFCAAGVLTDYPVLA